MTKTDGKHVIIVLTPGRSGSSLLMKALWSFGMRLSENMVPGSAGNPEGHFEDSEIVQAHRDLLKKLCTKPTIPAPDNWLESDPVRYEMPRLRKILTERMSQSDIIWGFRDPQTVTFLPLWLRILNQLGIVPVFLLSLRNPSAVVASLNLQISQEGAITEVQWLSRTTEALYQTGADCYIVHYEDWFTRPKELAEEILAYTGLDQSFNGDLCASIEGLVKPNRNRAVHIEYTVQNEYVLRLYDVLKECRGENFDRKRLMPVVKQCRKVMHDFKGWYLEVQHHIRENERMRQVVKEKEELLDKDHEKMEEKHVELEAMKERLQKKNDEIQFLEKQLQDADDKIHFIEGDFEKNDREKDKLISQMKDDLQKLTLQNNNYLQQMKDYHDEVEDLRQRIAGLSLEKKNVEPNQKEQPQASKKQSEKAAAPRLPESQGNLYNNKWRLESIELRNSYSFRLGKILIDSFIRPGKNTVLAPYYLIALVWDMVSGRGRLKAQEDLKNNSGSMEG